MKRNNKKMQYHSFSTQQLCLYERYGHSKVKHMEKNRENAIMRQKINPRIVLSDPDVFFNDLLTEQSEQM